MYFNKIHNPPNFAFIPTNGLKKNKSKLPGHLISLKTADLGEDVFEISYESNQWDYRSDSGLDLNAFTHPSRAALKITPNGGFSVSLAKSILLETKSEDAFGVCGKSWMMQFTPPQDSEFYGMGEKNNGFEKSGLRTKFWNTDVWADFHQEAFINGTTDPMYLSIPYLIIKQGNTYVGLLIDNPYPSFMGISPRVSIGGEQMELDVRQPFFIGADHGTARVYVIVGDDLEGLTRKYQRLVGVTPRPPLWALGYQQCRWGYKSHKCLDDLDKNFRKHKIPCDGLWLDIDYMDGYRIFTYDKKHFARASAQIADINGRGRKVVPIFDPGVKLDPGYKVYEEGRRADIYCKSPVGKDFVGFVWPGATVFPDFASPRARKWWADQVARFVKDGIYGAWLDMNDPAVGASELDSMLFNKGKWTHDVYHNQYALGMAMATRQGFLQAHPDKRPFLLSRSGFTGIGKYAAIWTGDNYSNEHHLKNAIPISLNLALSGVPFNGPDAGGFGGDTNAALMIAWYKMQFLFPFFRNHTHIGTRDQEPWAFDRKTLGILGNYIRERYKLLPYLYNLYIGHEREGTAIMRPLFYDFQDSRKLPLGKVDDQFMCGPAIMQAPVLSEKAMEREVVLPKAKWYSTLENGWITGGRKLRVKQTAQSTPLYFRDGSVVPMQEGQRTSEHNDLRKVELHLFVSRTLKGQAEYRYIFDDGESYAYRKGQYSEALVRVNVRGKNLEVTVQIPRSNCGNPIFSFVTYESFDEIRIKSAGIKEPLILKSTPRAWSFAGRKLRAFRTKGVQF